MRFWSSHRLYSALAIILATLMLALAACTPEERRERGGDRGGDIGNTGRVVRMHGDVDAVEKIYYQTPPMGKGIERSGQAGAIHPEP
jgi:hypothetical protein